jgi:hypothetical protein
MTTTEDFDVLLSFAGSERTYARAIHDIAVANGLKVFLDEEMQADIWGKNLVEYLHEAYSTRGRFVLALISSAYGNRAYTTVERRAALDRLITQHSEYLLPVVVEDAWIPGLPKSTAYIDLRRSGVLGVCELLVEKVTRQKSKLIVPDGVRVPRVPRGLLRSADIAGHLLDLCRDEGTAIFGALIYDETTIALRNLLSNQTTWDALDVATGPNFELFAVRDERKSGTDAEFNIGLATAYSMSSSQDKGYFYSKLLKDYFGEDKTTLVYPSVLIFVVDSRKVQKCWLVPGRRAGVQDSLDWLIGLSQHIRDSLSQSGGATADTKTVVANLKRNLLAHKYTLYIQSAPTDPSAAVGRLAEFIEEPGTQAHSDGS